MPLEVRMLGPADGALFDRVAPGVFDNAVDPARAAEFLADPRHHMAVALLDGELVGMASAVHYVHPDKPPELWVNEVGVAPPQRNQGIGRRLLEALFERARELGCSAAWCGTEPGNAAARRMYAAAGGAELPMVYVTFDFNGADMKPKQHLEFVKVDLDSGWERPAGYPPGFYQKILASDLDEERKRGSRTRLLKIEPGAFSTEPFVHDHWEEVYLVQGDLVVGNDKEGKGGQQSFAPTYACRPPGVHHGPFSSRKGCILHEIHYYETSGKK